MARSHNGSASAVLTVAQSGALRDDGLRHIACVRGRSVRHESTPVLSGGQGRNRTVWARATISESYCVYGWFYNDHNITTIHDAWGRAGLLVHEAIRSIKGVMSARPKAPLIVTLNYMG